MKFDHFPKRATGNRYNNFFLLKESARDADYVCRYGGEEFSVILGNTLSDSAVAIAERLREKIENHSFSENVSHQDLRLTVSIGIASYPAHSSTKEDLIHKADQAMYTAKFIGKNKVCVYGV